MFVTFLWATLKSIPPQATCVRPGFRGWFWLDLLILILVRVDKLFIVNSKGLFNQGWTGPYGRDVVAFGLHGCLFLPLFPLTNALKFLRLGESGTDR